MPPESPSTKATSIPDNEFEEEYLEPDNDETKNRLTNLESEIKAIKEQFMDVGAELTNALNELKERPTVLGGPPPKTSETVTTIKDLAKIQVDQMKPLTEMAQAFMSMGIDIGRLQSTAEHEGDRADQAIEVLEKFKIEMETTDSKKNYGEAVKEFTPLVEKLIDMIRGK